MCGRLVRDIDFDAKIAGFYEFSETRITVDLGHYFGVYNISPTQTDIIIRPEEDGRHLVASRWNLTPFWARDKKPLSMFNARSESILEKASFKGLVARNRCVVPVSGFYEWKRPTPKEKTPLYIHPANDGPLLLAGLWTSWKDDETGEDRVSHTILTCEPNEYMSSIHNRMPVVLDVEGMDEWLHRETVSPADVMPLLRPCPEDVLIAHEVSTRVNGSRNDGPDLIEPVES